MIQRSSWRSFKLKFTIKCEVVGKRFTSNIDVSVGCKLEKSRVAGQNFIVNNDCASSKILRV